MHARFLSALCAAVMGVCVIVPSAAGQQQATLYQRMGSYDRIAAVVDDFLGRFTGDARLAPLLGGLNAAAGARVRQHFVDFICARTGGPCLYNGQDMKSAHTGLPITGEHFESVIGHFKAALEAQKVAPREREEVLSLLRSLRSEIVPS